MQIHFWIPLQIHLCILFSFVLQSLCHGQDSVQLDVVQFFKFCYDLVYFYRGWIILVKKFLWGDLEILADIKKGLHGGEGLPVFDPVDIASVLA